jgi:hypothetical protein
VTLDPLRAHFEIRLCCPDCNSADFICPYCAEPFRLAMAPWAGFPFIPPPQPCPDCGALIHVRVLGYHPNPTNERPAAEALSDDLARLERAYHNSNSRPPAVQELAEAWARILAQLQLPSTRMLLAQQARLEHLEQTRAVVAVAASWAPLIESRAQLIVDAIEQLSGHRPALRIRAVHTTARLPVVAPVRPPAPQRPAPAAATTPRRRPPARRSRRPRPARPAPRRRAPAAPPPTYRQPCPAAAERLTISQWQAQGVPLEQLPPATIARGFREVFGCEPRRLRQSRAYSAQELCWALWRLGNPAPAAMARLQEVVK